MTVWTYLRKDFGKLKEGEHIYRTLGLLEQARISKKGKFAQQRRKSTKSVQEAVKAGSARLSGPKRFSAVAAMSTAQTM